MAEVFGIAAGAVGVVSLSIQLAESLQKVKHFYASVKNAPLQVAELVEEIEIMQDILSDLEASSQTVASSSNMKRCIKVAQRATKSFAKFSEELQASIERRKYRGGARFALGQNDIRQILNQLERTKSSLSLAYSLYQQATAEDRHIVVMQAVLSRQDTAMQTIQANQGPDPAQDSFALDYSKSQAPRIATPAGKKLLHITTPKWLKNTIWELELRRVKAGFNIFAKTYGIVPRNAPIIRACKQGNIAEMQRLFDCGLASPYDMTEAGLSLWTTATVEICIDSLRFLSRHYVGSDQALAFPLFHRHAITDLWLEENSSGACGLRDDIAWLRDVQIGTDHTYDGIEDHPYTLGALRLLACPSEDVNSLLFWQTFERFDYFVDVPSFSERLAKEMLNRYNPDYHGGKQVLQLLAVSYGLSVTFNLWLTALYRNFSSAWTTKELAVMAHRLDYLENTIAVAVSSGANIHEAGQCHTSLFLFLSMRLSPIANYKQPGSVINDVRPRMLRRHLKSWLRTLQGAGMDLVTYGAKESREFERYKASQNLVPDAQCWHYLEAEIDSANLFSFSFSYGPQPEDWTVELDIPVERYACEFWQMPGLYDDWLTKAIPGGWVGD